MPKFVKQILRPGEYYVSTPSGGRKRKKFDVEDLKRYANTSREMLKEGLRIPAPRQHTLEARPEEAEGDATKDYQNLGYWEDFYTARDDDGQTSLYGILNAPGSEDDDTTPAGIVSRTARDVSICSHDFEDGKGKKWEDALWHVALPAHPIEMGQSNFTPLPDSDVEVEMITMSQMVPQFDVGKLLTVLNKCGLSLPSDTTQENVLERLYVAASQKAEGYDSDGGVTKKPNDSKVEVYPIMMSLSSDQVEAILKAEVTDPKTGKPFSSEVFADTPDESDKLKKSVTLMSNMLGKNLKDGYSARVKALIASGRVSEDYAKASIYPMIENLEVKEIVQMGLTSEELPKNAVEVTLQALEALPGKEGSSPNSQLWMSQKPAGAETPEQPLSDDSSVSDEESQDIIKSILEAVS